MTPFKMKGVTPLKQSIVDTDAKERADAKRAMRDALQKQRMEEARIKMENAKSEKTIPKLNT